MTYQEFVQELIDRHGEETGVLMALRTEVGFLRRYLVEKYGDEFIRSEQDNITDFLNRHP